jgi:transcriptional regulator with GAF, ATPase, and Fis domain
MKEINTVAEENQAIVELEENITRIEQYLNQMGMGLAQSAVKLHQFGVQSPIDVDRLIGLADLEQKRLQRNSRRVSRQLNQLQELVRTSALMTSSLDLEHVLQDVIDTVISLTGAERAFLMLRVGDDFRVHAARDWDKESLSDDEISFSRSIINAAMEQRTPLITTNAQEDDRFSGLASVVRHDLRSIIVTPLIWQEKPQGVLYADNRLMMGVFQDDIIPLLSAFANQAAIAIANARLFEQVKDDLAEARREVQRLRIQIDEKQVYEQVKEITENDYFQNLSSRARSMRQRSEQKKKGDS